MDGNDEIGYSRPLAVVTSLFLIWALSNNLMPAVIKQIMNLFSLDATHASLTETCYWSAYAICPIPLAILLNRYGYKTGIMVGLCLGIAGCLTVIPSIMSMRYGAIAASLFIIAAGMCCVETAANPLVTLLGSEKGAASRLNMAQSFNGVGAFIAAMGLSKMILADIPETAGANLGGTSLSRFYILLVTVLAVAVLAVLFTRFPVTRDGSSLSSGTVLDLSILRRPHFRRGVAAQFLLCGAMTSMNSMLLIYCCRFIGIEEQRATTIFGIYMLAYLVGRWTGSLLMTRIAPQRMLAAYSGMCVLLCSLIAAIGGTAAIWMMPAVGFFMSIIYPTQFSLALRDLGSGTRSGSALLMMAILGNAAIAPVTAHIMDTAGARFSMAYAVPAICFTGCLLYGLSGCRITDRTE